jgi:hypothetical protein
MTRLQLRSHATARGSKRVGALALLLPLLGICSAGCAAEALDAETARVVAERPQFSEAMVARIRAGKEGLGQPLTDAQRAEVLAILRTQGRKLTDAIFSAEDIVVFDTDVIVDGRAVLRDSRSEQKKGRWQQGWDPMYSYNVTGYNVVWVNNVGAWPNADWQSALEEAMAEYANKTNVFLTFTPPMTPRSTIWVNFQNMGPNYVGARGYSTPYGDIDNPGSIDFNTGFNGAYSQFIGTPCYNKTLATLPHWVKVATALHELGHSLGFAHYDDGTHIGGTQDISNGYYSTVMDPGCNNGTTLSTLSNDDVDMVNFVYYTN